MTRKTNQNSSNRPCKMAKYQTGVEAPSTKAPSTAGTKKGHSGRLKLKSRDMGTCSRRLSQRAKISKRFLFNANAGYRFNPASKCLIQSFIKTVSDTRGLDYIIVGMFLALYSFSIIFVLSSSSFFSRSLRSVSDSLDAKWTWTSYDELQAVSKLDGIDTRSWQR